MLDFPSFKAWWKATLLFLPFYGIALVIPIFIFWHFLVISVILTIEQVQAAAFAWAVTAGMLVSTIIGYFLILLIYSLVLKLLWSNPPQWLHPPQSLRKNLFHLSVAIGATLPISAINIFYLISIESVEALTQTNLKPIYLPKLLWKLSWIWLIAAAYLYQWRLRVERK